MTSFDGGSADEAATVISAQVIYVNCFPERTVALRASYSLMGKGKSEMLTSNDHRMIVIVSAVVLGLAALLPAVPAIGEGQTTVIRIVPGHPWRPPFGLDRVGGPPVWWSRKFRPESIG
jgi:hypothetical protein